MDNLFSIYVRDNENWMEGIKVLMYDTYFKMDELNKVIQKSNNDKLKELSGEILTDIAWTHREYSDRLEDLTNMRVKNDTVENMLRRKIKALELENTALKNSKVDSLTVNNTSSIENIQINELSSRVEEVLELIENNRKALMASVNMKDKDRKPPRLIENLDTDELIREYIANDCKITKGMKERYKDEYGITYNGLMERLIKRGVWKGRDK